jgi:hypothetical protein
MMRAMDICHAHNLTRQPASRPRYGVRVRLTAADPLHRVLGGEFERTHWFANATERDRALADMAGNTCTRGAATGRRYGSSPSIAAERRVNRRAKAR